ncbi:MAG TPA: DUF192 domain-containing protein [Chloroflexia bacterium]|nr:DUF192 domain-containing protein [Chloroflexia bacterium]
MSTPPFTRGRPAAGPLRNVTRDTVVASEVRMATSPWARGLGLMGHPGLAPGQALVLQPESSIHMFFMRCPLDVLFLDKDDRVLHLYTGLRPWRVSRIVRGSKRVVEMPVGGLAGSGTQVGDQLALGPAP